MELTKKNLLIVGGIIILLLLAIVLLGKKPKSKTLPQTAPSTLDFNTVEVKEEKEEIVLVNTPSPISNQIITIPTANPSPTHSPTPTLIATPFPTRKPTPTTIPTRKPTRIPTATPTPDNSIKATGVSLNVIELNLEINQSFQILSRVEPNDTTDKY